MKFLLLRKNREAENGSTWTLFVAERSPRQERPAQQAERYQQALATKDQPDEETPF
jgi:hypothetical protein